MLKNSSVVTTLHESFLQRIGTMVDYETGSLIKSAEIISIMNKLETGHLCVSTPAMKRDNFDREGLMCMTTKGDNILYRVRSCYILGADRISNVEYAFDRGNISQYNTMSLKKFRRILKILLSIKKNENLERILKCLL